MFKLNKRSKTFFPLSINCGNSGIKPTSEELTSEHENVKINIIDKIMRELNIPRLRFLNDIFRDFFLQMLLEGPVTLV